MDQEQTFIFVICYAIAIILLYKYFLFKNKTKGMIVINAICTDTTLKTTYQKNIRYYYYEYEYNKEKYTTLDKSRFKIPGFNIRKTFKIYINPKNPDITLNPLEIFYSKIYLVLVIILFITPFIFI